MRKRLYFLSLILLAVAAALALFAYVLFGTVALPSTVTMAGRLSTVIAAVAFVALLLAFLTLVFTNAKFFIKLTATVLLVALIAATALIAFLAYEASGIQTYFDGNFREYVLKNDVEYLRLPDGKNNIGYMEFANCDSLKTVSIPKTVTAIGVCAFFECDSLKNVKIAEGVSEIGRSAFYGCSNLKSVTIPKTVMKIDDYAFASCSELTTVFYGGSKADFAKIQIGSENSKLKNANIVFGE